MISFRPLWETMANRGATTYTLQQNGISSSTIARMKMGQSVSTDTLDRLCTVLNCTVSDLLEYRPEPPKKA